MLKNQNKTDHATPFLLANSRIRPSMLLALTISLALGNAQGQTRWTSEFSDAHGWNQSKYGTTIMYGDLNGDGRMDVCGRGAAGIYCSLSNGSSFVGVSSDEGVYASADFSDQTGWDNPIYYSTLRLADVNGDGKADVCGRGYWGVYCALGRGDGTFEAAQLWTTDYGNLGGWGFLQYGGTIMFGDLNGDGRNDVCARGGDGLYCALSTGTGFSPYHLAGTSFSDPLGWTDSAYYSSIRLGDVNGDGYADACGRGPAGILCTLGKGDGTFGPSQLWSSDFNDADHWNQIQYASTIMLGDINGDGIDDVCGRGPSGIYCAISTGSSFRSWQILTSDFADSEGDWSRYDYYYRSLRLADINGDGQADVCGRGGDGIECALATTIFR